MAVGLMTMQGELIDRRAGLGRSSIEVRRVVHRARRNSRPTDHRSAASPHEPDRGRRRLRRTDRLGAETVSPLNIFAWRDFPLRQRLGGDHLVTGVRRARREGAGAGRGLAGRRAGPAELPGDGGQHRHRWWHRARTVNCSTAPAATPATSATSSSSPTVVAACAGRGMLSRRRRRGRPSRRSPAGSPTEPTYEIMQRTGRLVGSRRRHRCATCSTSTSSSSADRSRSGSRATFFNSAQAALDEHAKLSFAASARITPARLGRSRPADRRRRRRRSRHSPRSSAHRRTGR